MNSATIRIVRVIGMIAMCYSVFTTHSAAQDDLDVSLSGLDSIKEEMEFLEAETYVITASRVLENIRKTAASITVITDEDIRRMGARHLMDVLNTVPGFSTYYLINGQYYVVEVRGIEKQYSQHIVLMINGQPVNSHFLGSATWTLDTLILDNVKQIEIIRGPGSTLYGANAFAGIINVITKDAKDIQGSEFSVKFGSYNTQQYNFLFGETYNDIEFVWNVNYLTTDGFPAYVEEDRQSILDRYFHTHASLAPGETEAGDEKFDASMTIAKGKWRLDGRYIDRRKDTGVALGFSLNDKNMTYSVDYSLELSYEDHIAKGWDLSGKIYHHHCALKNIIQMTPPGAAALTAPYGEPVIMPDGMIGIPSNKNERTGGEIQATFRSSENNTLVFGGVLEAMRQFDVEYAANFIYTPIENLIIPLPTTQDLTDIQNYNQNESRFFSAIFVEDIWDIRENLRITAGGRYDYYNDFGGSFNPRLGVVWQFMDNYDIKCLYGRAFRAPNFYELYSKNNPALRGNEDLNPETIDTYEISFGAKWHPSLSTRLTGFYNHIDDVIDPRREETQNVLANAGEMRTQGIESEIEYSFRNGAFISANFTYQKAENLSNENDETEVDVPKYKGNIMANVVFSEYVNVFTQYFFQGGFGRESDDDREDPENIGVVNTTLIVKNIIKQLDNLELRTSIYNLLDEDYSYPTPMDTIPGGYPMPGIHYIFELKFKF